MKQFGIILRFELKEIFSSKAFKAVTIIAVIIMALIMFVPKLIKTILTPSSLSNNTIAVSADWDTMNQTDVTAIQSAITKALPTDDVQFVTDDADTLQKQVKDEELDGAVMINAADFALLGDVIAALKILDLDTAALIDTVELVGDLCGSLIVHLPPDLLPVLLGEDKVIITFQAGKRHEYLCPFCSIHCNVPL